MIDYKKVIKEVFDEYCIAIFVETQTIKYFNKEKRWIAEYDLKTKTLYLAYYQFSKFTEIQDNNTHLKFIIEKIINRKIDDVYFRFVPNL